ncbi:MAG: hypothetical protein IJN42_06900 [Clostridia bacterium]|nr:hypothetical protein [Clostridia bacterium]
MSIWGPIGFYACMGIFVLYGLWLDERQEKKELQRQLRRARRMEQEPCQTFSKAA